MPNIEAGERTSGEQALQTAYRQAAAYSRISSRIVLEDDLQSACRLFLDAVREHSGYGRAVLTLFDEQGRDSQWFFTGLGDPEIDHFHGHRMTPAQRAEVLQEKRRVGGSYFVPATPAIQHGGLRPGAGGGKDLLFIPLHGVRGTLTGILMLEQPRDLAAPTPDALSPLEMFASQMAHAIEKKRSDLEVRRMQIRLRAAHEQLMQAEKMSAIGQLVSGVAHELNNPLAGIMGFAQLLLGGELNAKNRKSLERIHSEAVRCQKIVQNLLSFARRHKPEKSWRSLHDAIDNVLELRAYQLQVDNVEVVRRYQPDLPRTMFDFHQLQQVLLNVVNNAHQSMMEATDRPRRLTITTQRSGDRLRASFTDTGAGIARDRMERIFEPFYTTKTEGRGTGLGLSVSRAILKEHQGTLLAESVLGQGSTFNLDLPILAEQHAVAERPGAEAPARQAQPLRLLVVDDEAILVELLVEFLRSAGHQVESAGDGRRALELATRSEFDVIVSDLKMPGLDGQGFYERLVKAKPRMARRFIFSTGDLANPKVQTFFQAAGCPYLSKPFKLEAVLKLLDQVARDARAA
ncbi:MAG: hybrid sensor histidine kinase/response regulator [Candidatus Polarisedimenticolia bacterium]